MRKARVVETEKVTCHYLKLPGVAAIFLFSTKITGWGNLVLAIRVLIHSTR